MGRLIKGAETMTYHGLDRDATKALFQYQGTETASIKLTEEQCERAKQELVRTGKPFTEFQEALDDFARAKQARATRSRRTSPKQKQR